MILTAMFRKITDNSVNTVNTILCQNDQTRFKNLAVFATRFLESVWRF